MPFGRIISVLVILLSGFALLHAQQQDTPPASSQQRSSSLLVDTDTAEVEPQLYMTPLDFYHLRNVVIDSLNRLTHQYDPARREVLHHGTLGNLGAAQRTQFFEPIKTKGLDFGQHQYDLYKRRFAEFKFYDSETPITEFDYSQGARQLDGILQGRFGKNFAQGIKLSVDYQRINQTGLYQEQRAKHTAFGVGVWYDAPSGFYDGLYHYSSNSIVQQDNGGVINYDTIAGLRMENITDPIAIPVNLSGALTTHRERILSVQNHFHLNRTNDSIPKRFLIDLIHTGQAKNGLFKFYDESVSGSEEYYGDFLVDDRGVRHYMYYRSIDNRVDLQFRIRKDPADESDISSQLLYVGIQHRFTALDQEPVRRNLNEVFFNASTRLSFTPRLDLRATGYIELAGQAGDFNVEGSLRYTIPKLGRVEAHLSLYQRTPTIIERELFITQIPIWQNDFNKPVYTRLGGFLRFDKIRAYVYGGLQVMGNHIYYDTDRLPVQLTEAQDIWQIVASKEINLGKIGLQATVAFQEAPEILGLPTLIGEAQFYYTDHWFKNNMEVRTGVDLRITNAYDGVGYFPASGQFHLSGIQIDQYPALDVFFDFQVRKSFRAFFKIENITAFWNDDVYAHVVYHPQFRTYFRFGLWMRLFN